MKQGIDKRSCFILGVYLSLFFLCGLYYFCLRASFIEDGWPPSEATSSALIMWIANLCGPLQMLTYPYETQAFAEGVIVILMLALSVCMYLIKPSRLTGFLVIVSLVVWFACGFVGAHIGI